MPLRERLPPRPSSVGEARRLVRAAGGEALSPDLVETAELLVSELVSNAIVHAGTPIDIEVSVVNPTEVLVTVGDGSPHRPVLRSYGDTAATGRGLRLVNDMSDDWGVTTGEVGKTVWFRLSATGSAARPGMAQEPGVRAAGPENVAVELLNVPLVLHARWQQQAEALLREYLLVTLEDEEAFDEVIRHAQCSDAVALLAESIPEPGTGDGRVADENGEIWCPRATMSVPLESVEHFVTLDETLDRALDMAASDLMLTPPIDPECQRLRRWVCRQVADQANGLPPRPWEGR